MALRNQSIVFLNLYLIFQIVNFVAVSAVLNVTILIYGIRVQQLLQSLPYTAPGFDLGIRDALRRYSNSFELSQVYVSKNLTTCDDTGSYFDQVSSYYYKNRLENTPTVVFYPGCDDSRTFAQLGREWKIFIVSTGTTFSNLRDRDLYPSTIAFGPVQYEIYGVFAKTLLRTYQWSSVSFIYDISGRTPFNRIVFTRIQNYLHRYAKDIQLYPFQIDFGVGEDKIPYEQIIFEFTKLSRVVFISVPHPSTRSFLVVASKKGWKAGDIVWISIDVPIQAPRGTLQWKSGNVDDTTALEAFRSVFKLESCSGRDPMMTTTRNLLQELRNLSENVYNVTFPPNQGPSELAFTAYSAIEVFAQVLAETLRDFDNLFDGAEIAKRYLNRTFDLTTGDQIYVDSFGERQNRMCFLDFNIRTQLFDTVQYFEGKDTMLYDLPNRTIDWGTYNGLPPANEPLCGFEHDKLVCSSTGSMIAITITVTLTVSIFVLMTAGFYFVRKLKLKIDFHAEWWIIEKEHLIQITKSNTSNQLNRSRDLRKPLNAFQANYRGQIVYVRTILVTNQADTFPNPKARSVLKNLRLFSDRENICTLIGVVAEPAHITFVTEWCQKGSLAVMQEITWIDWELQCFFINDILQALLAIHGSLLRRHGHLCLSTCLVDKQLSIKIADTGFYDLITAAHLKVKRPHPVSYNVPEDWMAPELRDTWIHHGNLHDLVARAEAPADIYAFSIIMTFLTINNEKDLRVGNAVESNLIATQVTDTLANIIVQCQAELPAKRPTVSALIKTLTRISGSRQTRNLMDRLLQRLEAYSIQLELAIGERTKELLDERLVCDALLQEVLPKEMISRLRSGIMVVPQVLDDVSVFFSYLLDFSEFVQSHQHNPLHILEFISDMFSLFDDIIGTFDVYKVETISDTYMAASGLTKTCETAVGHYHVLQICHMAKAFVNTFHAPSLKGYRKIQIGIHTGMCAGGIIGSKRPRYCLFGDTVNTASRLASQSEPSKIHLSEVTACMIRGTPGFTLTKRGTVHLKGKGDLTTYWLS